MPGTNRRPWLSMEEPANHLRGHRAFDEAMADEQSAGNPAGEVDWRCRAATTLARDLPAAGPGAPFHPRGTSVVLATAAKIRRQVLEFYVPGGAALLLDQAVKARRVWKTTNPLMTGQAGHPSEVSHLVFDAIGASATMVMTCYAAIESYVNECLPKEKRYRRQERNKVKVREMVWVERYVPLKEKMAQVLPQVAGAEDPTQKSWWAGFQELEKRRHETVHLKPRDTERWSGRGNPPDTIWRRLLDPRLANGPRVAIAAIRHFASLSPQSWIQNAPVDSTD